MNCNDAVSYIKSLTNRGIVPGLTVQNRLLEKLGNPHRNLPVIHIAGTNGKGSVGAYLSSILIADGKRVCRFISPCVGDYRNTFLINGEPVDEKLLADCIERVKSAIDELDCEGVCPTSFEAETATAFLMFNKLSPDYAVIECGMGGRLDATNVVRPILSVITKISYDHTSFLGNTLTDIATEKAGIIKHGVPVVTTRQESAVSDVLKSTASNRLAPFYVAEMPENIVYTDSDTAFTVNGVRYETRLLGTYQPQNAALAIKCAEVLGVDAQTIANGVADTRWEYRFERIGKFILDGTHNPDGATALRNSLEIYTKPGKTAFICACFKDKEYRKIARITSPMANRVICIKAPTERGLDPNVLADTFTRCGVCADTAPNLKTAIENVVDFENVVIFGTLSILADAKEIIERIYHNDSLQQDI